MSEATALSDSSPLRRHAPALLLISMGLLCLLAYLPTVIVRLDLTQGSRAPVVALALLTLCLVVIPLRGSRAIFLARNTGSRSKTRAMRSPSRSPPARRC